MKSFSKINSAIMENREWSIIKVRHPSYQSKWRVLIKHDVSLRFVSSYFEHFR